MNDYLVDVELEEFDLEVEALAGEARLRVTSENCRVDLWFVERSTVRNLIARLEELVEHIDE